MDPNDRANLYDPRGGLDAGGHRTAFRAPDTSRTATTSVRASASPACPVQRDGGARRLRHLLRSVVAGDRARDSTSARRISISGSTSHCRSCRCRCPNPFPANFPFPTPSSGVRVQTGICARPTCSSGISAFSSSSARGRVVESPTPGSRARGCYGARDINQAAPSAAQPNSAPELLFRRHQPAGIALEFELPRMQASVRQQFRRGLTFFAGYTWAKSIDDASGLLSERRRSELPAGFARSSAPSAAAPISTCGTVWRLAVRG